MKWCLAAIYLKMHVGCRRDTGLPDESQQLSFFYGSPRLDEYLREMQV